MPSWLLDLDLDRQAVGVPPGPAGHGSSPAWSDSGRTGPCRPGPTRGGGRDARWPSAAPRRTPRARHPARSSTERSKTRCSVHRASSSASRAVKSASAGTGRNNGYVPSGRCDRVGSGRREAGPAARRGAGDTTGAEGPQLTCARTPRGGSPDRRPVPTDGRTPHRPVPADVVRRPEDGGAAASTSWWAAPSPGVRAAGQVRVHRRRRPVAGGPSGPRRLGPVVRAVLPATAIKPGRSPIALRVGLDDGAGFDVTEMGTEKRLALWVVRSPGRGRPPGRTRASTR